MLHNLTEREADQYRADGFVGPFRLCSPDEMAPIAERVRREVLTNDGPAGSPLQSRHQDSSLIFDLCTRAPVLDRMEGLLGPDLVLWRSHLFDKPPGAPEVPWHQDINYWPLEPPLNVSAWIALDDVSKANSCMRFIPGSHRETEPHIAAEEGMLFAEMADPAFFDRGTAVDIVAKPGEFYLFNDRLLHQSDPNRSDRQRLALAVRVTLPIVKVEHGQLHDQHGVMIVRGRDRMGLNRVIEPPGLGRASQPSLLKKLYGRSSEFFEDRVGGSSLR